MYIIHAYYTYNKFFYAKRHAMINASRPPAAAPATESRCSWP